MKLVHDLPEEVGLEEVHYRLYLREKLEAAEEDVTAGRVLSAEAVAEEVGRWLSESSGPERL
jgi:hypothetical protein